MSAAVYPPAKVDEKKYRENYDRIFNKGNNMSDAYEMEIGDLKDQIKELEEGLHQQRFNNHHNFTVDQKVIDQIAKLERDNEVLKEACEKITTLQLLDYDLVDARLFADKALSKIRSEG